MQAAAAHHQAGSLLSAGQEQQGVPHSFSGFTTCTGKPVMTSAEGQQRACAVLAGSPEPAQATTAQQSTASVVPAFTTGACKGISISEAADQRGKRLFGTSPTASSADTLLVPIPELEHGRSHIAAAQPLGASPAAGMLAGQPAAPAESPAQPGAFAGFTTCTGKKVEPSRAAQLKGAALMQGAAEHTDAEMQPQQTPAASRPELGSFAGFTTCTGKKVELSRAAQLRGAALMHEAAEQADAEMQTPAASKPGPSTFRGFTTCTGKKVELSRAAQLRGAALMQEAAEQADPGQQTPAASKPGSFAGFTTCSGKQVQPSRAGQLRAAKLLQDSAQPAGAQAEQQQNPTTPAPAPAFAGFATATGRHIYIDEQARQRAAALMSDDPSAPMADSHAQPQTPVLLGRHAELRDVSNRLTAASGGAQQALKPLLGGSPMLPKALAAHQLAGSPCVAGERLQHARPAVLLHSVAPA